MNVHYCNVNLTWFCRQDDTAKQFSRQGKLNILAGQIRKLARTQRSIGRLTSSAALHIAAVLIAHVCCFIQVFYSSLWCWVWLCESAAKRQWLWSSSFKQWQKLCSLSSISLCGKPNIWWHHSHHEAGSVRESNLSSGSSDSLLVRNDITYQCMPRGIQSLVSIDTVCSYAVFQLTLKQNSGIYLQE